MSSISGFVLHWQPDSRSRSRVAAGEQRQEPGHPAGGLPDFLYDYVQITVVCIQYTCQAFCGLGILGTAVPVRYFSC